MWVEAALRAFVRERSGDFPFGPERGSEWPTSAFEWSVNIPFHGGMSLLIDGQTAALCCDP